MKEIKMVNRKIKHECLQVISQVEKQIQQVLALRREEKALDRRKADESVYKDNDILQAKQKELENQNLNNREIKKQIDFIY